MVEPFIIFSIDGASYAVRADQVQQIEIVENVTHVPNTPNFVDGIVYSRGKVVPVINLRKRFGLDRIPYDIYSRLIVIEVDYRVIGLAVDSAREFVHLDPTQILPPPETLSGPGVEYLEGVYSKDERIILVINLHHLLAKQEKDQLLKQMEDRDFEQELESSAEEAKR
jgi:purine-binding chemotaxis protein CheW